MNNLRVVRQALGLASRASSRQSFRSYSYLIPSRTSPFHRMLTRHRDRLSVRHLLRRRRHYSSQPNPNPASLNSNPAADANLSLSQRLKNLSKKYGWAALGVYFGLTILDMPFFFLAVRSIGTERIGHYEHAVVEWIKGVLPFDIPRFQWPWQKEIIEGPEAAELAAAEIKYTKNDQSAEESSKDGKAQEEASFWTQLLLAYALHKSFIFIRIPITVAITPKVVKTLRGWGWNIGNPTAKTGSIAAQAGKG